jgi:beta-N-acetylhexosaminidase
MRRKAWYRSAFKTQVLTFVLGMVVGACLYYALSDIFFSGSTSKEESVLAQDVADEISEKEPSAVEKESPVLLVPEQAIEPVPADMESLWPLRHVIVGLEGEQLSRANIDMLNSWKPGGVWLREKNTENPRQIAEMISLINLYASLDGTRAKNPLVCMIQEGGEGLNALRMGNALSYQDLASLESLEAIKDVGRQVAETALNTGVGVLLAPRMDIFFPGQTAPEERFRYLSDNKESVVQAGLAYAGGLMEGGALAVVGNYPGMGSALFREQRLPVVEETDIERLAEIMLPFAEAAASDISGFLVGSVSVPILDKEQPDRPASLSSRLVREVLRRQFGYTGVVLASDILDVAVWSGRDAEEDIVDALKAGCDAVFISSVSGEELGRIAQEITSAVEKGVLEKEELDASARRLDLWRQHIAEYYPVPPEEAAAEDAEGEEEPDSEVMESETVGAEETEEAVALEEPAPAAEEEAAAVVTEVTVEEEPEASPEEPVDEEEEIASGEAPAEESPEEPEVLQDAEPEEETEKESEKEPEKVVETPRVPTPQPAGTKAISYTIQPGDTLSKIATSHQVSTTQLMQWNGLSNGDIKFGRKLTVYVPDLPAEEESGEIEEAAATEEVPQEEEVGAPVVEEQSVETAVEVEEKEEEIHSVEEPPTEEMEEEETHSIEEPPAEEREEEAAEKSADAPDELSPPLVPFKATETPDGDEEVVLEAPDANFDLNSDMEYQPVPEVLEESEDQPAPQEEETIAEEETEEEGAESVSSPAAEEEVATPSETDESVSGEFTTHTIEAGDTLHSIANRYNTTVQNLIKINDIKDANVIVLGRELKVPMP